jgi:hypothetical protein
MMHKKTIVRVIALLGVIGLLAGAVLPAFSF